jgi:hypothetical protein
MLKKKSKKNNTRNEKKLGKDKLGAAGSPFTIIKHYDK